MNKKLVLIIISIVIVLIGVVLVILKLTSSNTIEITRTESQGVPYNWECEIEDSTIVEYVKKYDLDKNKKTKGGSHRINYVFKGIKKGTTKVIFKKVDYYSGEIVSEEEITLKVNVRKDISLVVIPKE